MYAQLKISNNENAYVGYMANKSIDQNLATFYGLIDIIVQKY